MTMITIIASVERARNGWEDKGTPGKSEAIAGRESKEIVPYGHIITGGPKQREWF